MSMLTGKHLAMEGVETPGRRGNIRQAWEHQPYFKAFINFNFNN